MGALDGKVALITGGNSGIGLAAAKRFVEEGAYVFITARRQAELDKAVSLVGKNVKAIQGDITRVQDLDRIAAAVRAERGIVDVIISNAGITERGRSIPLRPNISTRRSTSTPKPPSSWCRSCCP